MPVGSHRGGEVVQQGFVKPTRLRNGIWLSYNGGEQQKSAAAFASPHVQQHSITRVKLPRIIKSNQQQAVKLSSEEMKYHNHMEETNNRTFIIRHLRSRLSEQQKKRQQQQHQPGRRTRGSIGRKSTTRLPSTTNVQQDTSLYPADQVWEFPQTKSQSTSDGDVRNQDQGKLLHDYNDLSFDYGFFDDAMSVLSAKSDLYGLDPPEPEEAAHHLLRKSKSNNHHHPGVGCLSSNPRPSIVVSTDTGFVVDLIDSGKSSSQQQNPNFNEEVFLKENTFLWTLPGLQDGSRLPDIPRLERENSSATIYFLGGKHENRNDETNGFVEDNQLVSVERYLALQEKPEVVEKKKMTTATLKVNNKEQVTNGKNKFLLAPTSNIEDNEGHSGLLRRVRKRPVTSKRRLTSRDRRSRSKSACNKPNTNKPLSARRRKKHVANMDLNAEELSKCLRQIYLGRVTTPSPLVKRKVSVYISSCGRDTCIEREYIRHKVVPFLRRFCRSRNVDFEMIDLQPTADEIGLNINKFSSFPASFRHHLLRDCFVNGIGVAYLSFRSADNGDRFVYLPELIPEQIYNLVSNQLEKNISMDQISLTNHRNKEEDNIEGKTKRSANIKLLEANIERLMTYQQLFHRYYILNLNTNHIYHQLHQVKLNLEIPLRQNPRDKARDEDILLESLLEYSTHPNEDVHSSTIVRWMSTICQSPQRDELEFILNSSFAGRKKAINSCFWLLRNAKQCNENQQQQRQNNNNNNKTTENRLKELQGNLYEEIIHKIGYSNLRSYDVSKQVLDDEYSNVDLKRKTSSKSWQHYLHKMGNDLYFSCTMKIEQEIKTKQLEKRNLSMEEINYHVMHAQEQMTRCIGRNDILDSIKYYVINSNTRHPLIVYGAGRSGKSATLSKASMMCERWFRTFDDIQPQSDNGEDVLPSCRVLFRSCNMSSDARHIRKLLASLCTQLHTIQQENNNQETTNNNTEEHDDTRKTFLNKNFVKISQSFKHYLECIASERCPLILFLDGLDKALFPQTIGSQYFKWLPRMLPKHVKIVISISSDVRSRDESPQSFLSAKFRLDDLQEHIDQPEAFLQLPPLSTDEAFVSPHIPQKLLFIQNLVDEALAGERRSLAINQMKLIADACYHFEHPLEVLLCAEATRDWTSEESVEDCGRLLRGFGPGLPAVLGHFLQRVEDTYGCSLVTSTCQLLAAAHPHGLMSDELQTLVAYDDKMAKIMGFSAPKKNVAVAEKSKSAYLNKSSTSANVSDLELNKTQDSQRRIPDLIWKPFISAMKSLLTEALCDNFIELCWSHHEVLQVATSRYMDAEGVELKRCNLLLAKYFNNQLGKADVPATKKSSKRQKLARRTEDSYTENQVIQPLMWRSVKEFPTMGRDFHRVNMRRVNRSVVFAITSFPVDVIKANSLCNYEWLHAKLSATSFEDLMEDIARACVVFNDDKDLKILSETLYLSKNILKVDPDQLGSQLSARLQTLVENDKPLARLDPRNFPYIKSLVVQTRYSSLPVFIPSNTCLAAPGDIVYDVTNGHKDGILAMALTSDGDKILTASKDGTLKFWQLANCKVTKTIDGIGRNSVKVISCMNNRYAAVVSEHNQVRVWSLQTSGCLLEFHENEHEHIAVTTAGESSNILLVLCSNSKTIKVWCLDKLKLLRQCRFGPGQISVKPEQTFIVANNSNTERILFSVKNNTEAYVYDVQRKKLVYTLKVANERSRISHVENSLEYYVIGCNRIHMRLHDVVSFELFDTISHNYMRTIPSCPGDEISNILINRLGTHIISFCTGSSGSDVGVWNMENGNHQHMTCQDIIPSCGGCADLQCCLIGSEETSSLTVCKLAARIMDGSMSRTRVKKKIMGISQFYPLQKDSRYIVARGNDCGPITVWNIKGGRCKGESVSIERGLLEKNDIVVVKGTSVFVLSDRGLARNENDNYLQVFTTIYVYNLHTKKYTTKLKSDVSICPAHEYRIIGEDRLLAVSHDRRQFQEWSLTTGKPTRKIKLDFSDYEKIEKLKQEEKNKRKRNRKVRVGGSKGDDHRHRWTNNSVSSQHHLLSTDLPTRDMQISGVIPHHLDADDRDKVIDQFLVSKDESTIICSFFSHHLAVVDVITGTHTHTLTDQDSLLLLHQAILTDDASHLIHSNYDGTSKTAYLTVWNVQTGMVERRLKDEPGICGMDAVNNAKLVVFATEKSYLKIWEPFVRGSVRSIRGCKSVIQPNKRGRGGNLRNVEIHLIESSRRAILCETDISLYDLQTETLLARFTADKPILCCTVAMDGNLIVLGMKDYPAAVTLRLMSRELNADWISQEGELDSGDKNFQAAFNHQKKKESTSSDEEFSSHSSDEDEVD